MFVISRLNFKFKEKRVSMSEETKTANEAFPILEERYRVTYQFPLAKGADGEELKCAIYVNLDRVKERAGSDAGNVNQLLILGSYRALDNRLYWSEALLPEDRPKEILMSRTYDAGDTPELFAKDWNHIWPRRKVVGPHSDLSMKDLVELVTIKRPFLPHYNLDAEESELSESEMDVSSSTEDEEQLERERMEAIYGQYHPPRVRFNGVPVQIFDFRNRNPDPLPPIALPPPQPVGQQQPQQLEQPAAAPDGGDQGNEPNEVVDYIVPVDVVVDVGPQPPGVLEQLNRDVNNLGEAVLADAVLALNPNPQPEIPQPNNREPPAPVQQANQGVQVDLPVPENREQPEPVPIQLANQDGQAVLPQPYNQEPEPMQQVNQEVQVDLVEPGHQEQPEPMQQVNQEVQVDFVEPGNQGQPEPMQQVHQEAQVYPPETVNQEQPNPVPVPMQQAHQEPQI